MKNLAIFASGNGSNARAIIEFFVGNQKGRVTLLVSNKAQAGALDMARTAGIDTLILTDKEAYANGTLADALQQRGIDYIILAGFLWKIPPVLIQRWPQNIINIHPALLPHFGGKGMYGRFVHEAVLAAGATETGITIHYVDEKYDHGQVIFQARCAVLPDDTPETLSARVQALEHAHYAPILFSLL